MFNYKSKYMLQRIGTNAGKVTITTILFGIVTIAFIFLFDVQHGGHVQKATADSATTSVTVLNIPPSWTNEAIESPASTSTSPTNDGSNVTWTAKGTDGNAEDYYLLICKDNTAPTPNQSMPPTCNGAGQWAVSTSTASAAVATATYAASSTDSETEGWYAFICDGNAGTPQCNAAHSGHETTADNKSPFNVNHLPTFTVFSDDSPTLPNDMVTWTATSSDPDSDGGADQVRLFVCKANDFTGSACGVGGTWATSTLSVSNPIATTTITMPTQDDDYSAYGFIVDEHGLAATGGSQGADSTLTVANATPSISNVSINGGAPISVTVEEGETTGFTVTFDVTDNNSCVANGSTTPEISSADINVYRSGVGSTSCQASGDYDPNNCYAGTKATTTWNVVCTQSGACLGPTHDTVEWTCTYPLWFVVDPTDAGSQYPGTTWLATALAVDDNSATSSLKEADSGVTLNQFLSFDMATTSISYGSFEPGDGNASTSVTTDLRSTGNVGLDENLYGADMCTTYPSCSGSATDTIAVANQHYATSTVAYASGAALATTTQPLELNAPKSTSTSSPATTNTYWGIQIPPALTLSGEYIGENTIMGVVGESADW